MTQSSPASPPSQTGAVPKRSFLRRHAPAILIIVVAFVAAGAVYYTSVIDRTPRVKLALVTNNQGPYWDTVIRGAQDAAARAKADLTVIRSEADANAQSQHVRDLLGQGVAGIAISPINPAAQGPVLDEAAGKAVLVTVDSDAPNSKRAVYVGTNDYFAGQSAAAEARAALPEGGPVLIVMRSIEMANGPGRRQGVIDNLLDRPFKPDRPADPLDADLKGPKAGKYPVVATVVYGDDLDKAPSLVADALKAHPDVQCVVGLMSHSAPLSVRAIVQAGRAGQVKVIGFDDADDTQAGLEAGTIYSSILQDQYGYGYHAVRVMADMARGWEHRTPGAPQVIQLPTTVLRKENLASLRSQQRIHQPATQKAG